MEEQNKKENQILGKQSIAFARPAYIRSYASIVGKKEGDGPLGAHFDQIEEDDKFGQKSWEEAESVLQKRTAELAIQKACMKAEDIRLIFAGVPLGIHSHPQTAWEPVRGFASSKVACEAGCARTHVKPGANPSPLPASPARGGAADRRRRG